MCIQNIKQLGAPCAFFEYAHITCCVCIGKLPHPYAYTLEWMTFF